MPVTSGEATRVEKNLPIKSEVLQILVIFIRKANIFHVERF